MSENFFHKLYEERIKSFQELIPYPDEILTCYKEFDAKLKKPDLLGKTINVNQKQFPKLFYRVDKLSSYSGIDTPKIYLYEDYCYGVEAKGADNSRIEISAKTLNDFSDIELDFLICREICRIKYGMVKQTAIGEQVLRMLNDTNIIPGIGTLKDSFQIVYSSWSRTSHYTADCYGYMMVKDITLCIKAILSLIMNNRELVNEINIPEYLKQMKDIYMLDDVISRFSENDEKIPYGPLRIKNLLAYATLN